MKVGGRGIDLRVATLPTVYGEKVVHADPRQGPGGAAPRGARASCPRRSSASRASYRKPYGTILVTGPTGSGKSTTLYATLNLLNEPDRNIITVEDPVEYRLPGINQVQINPKAGLDVRRRRCGRSCVPTPTSCSSVRSATARPRSSRSRPRSPVTSCCRPCTPTTPRRRRCDSSRWASSRSSSPARSTAWSPSASPAGSATSARSRTSRPRPSSSRRAGRSRTLDGGEWPTLYRAVGCTACGRTGYRGRFALHEVMLDHRGDRAPDHRAPLDRGHPEGRRSCRG